MSIRQIQFIYVTLIAGFILTGAGNGYGAKSVVRGRSKELFSIESKSVRRIVSIKDGRLKTVEIKNLLNGKVHKVIEDGFHIIWIPDGDYKKGEKVRLDEKNMKVSGKPVINEIEVKDVGLGGKEVKKKRTELRIPLACEEHPVKVDVIFTASKDDPVIRKKLIVKAPEGSMVLDAEVDRITFDRKMHIKWFDKVQLLPSHGYDGTGGWAYDMRRFPGYPIYAGDFYLGLEFRGGYNVVTKERAISLRHYPGKSLEKGATVWESWPAVIGAAADTPNDRVEDAFLEYINRISHYRKVRGNRAIIFDMPEIRPDCVNRPTSRHHSFPGHMFEAPLKYNEKIVKDDLARDAKGEPPHIIFFNVAGGGPGGSTSKRKGYNVFATAAREHGFEQANAGFWQYYCTAAPVYQKALLDFLTDLVKKHKLSVIQLDYFTLLCHRKGHGHLPIEPYAREALYEASLKVIQAVHKGNQECLTLSNGLWNDPRSPWWLTDADMLHHGLAHFQSPHHNPWFFHKEGYEAGDYKYAGSACNYTSYHDSYYFDKFVTPGRWFPVEAVNDGHHWGRGYHSSTLGKDAPPEEVLAHAAKFLFQMARSNRWYVSMNRYSKGYKDLHVPIYKWGAANEDILNGMFKPFGGPPSERLPYGWSHCPAQSEVGYIFIRNPFVLPRNIEITLGEELGLDPEKGHYSVIRVFPYREVLAIQQKAGSKLSLNLEGYESGVYRVVKDKEPAEPLFPGCRYDLVGQEEGAVIYDLYPAGKDVIKVSGPVEKVALVKGAADIKKGRVIPKSPQMEISEPKETFKRREENTATIVSGKVNVDVPKGVKAKLLVLAEPGIDLVNEKLYTSAKWNHKRYMQSYEYSCLARGMDYKDWSHVEIKEAGQPLGIETKVGARALCPGPRPWPLLWQWHIVKLPEGRHNLDITITANTKVKILKCVRIKVLLWTTWEEKPVRVKVKLADGVKLESKIELPELFPGHHRRTLVLYDDRKPGEPVPVRAPKYPAKRQIRKWLEDVIWIEEEQDDVNTGKPVKIPGREESSRHGERNPLARRLPFLEPTRLKPGETIAVDGVLDDGIWKKASSTTGFKLADGKEPDVKTCLRLARDGKNLYIAVECFDSEEMLKSLKADVKEHDGAVWQDDSVELFIDTEGKRLSYYQIILNAIGTTFDAHHFDAGQGETDWEPKYLSAVRVGKGKWVAELALPFSIFNEADWRKGKSSSEWGFNVLRSRKKKKEFIYWSPVGKGAGAHTPEKFGMLCGMPVAR